MNKKIDFINEKGNATPKIREQISEQVNSKLRVCLEENFSKENVFGNESGNGFSILVGVDSRNGLPIYARLDKTITQKTPDWVEKKSSKKKSSSTVVELGNLFD